MGEKMNMRYRGKNKEKSNGVVYTPFDLAEYVANEMIKYHNLCEDDSISILDPAVGEGNLLIALIKSLGNCKKKIHAVGYETDGDTCIKTAQYLSHLFPDVEIDIRNDDFLEAVDNGKVEKFDYIIANPPYIRTQIMGSDKAQKIAEKLSLTGRVDIYYAFLVSANSILKEGGIAGYITSNKFMTIKAGASVRNFALRNYKIHRIVDLGDTKLFNASVLPCIIIFENGSTDNPANVLFTSIYQKNADDVLEKAIPIKSIFQSVDETGYFIIPDGRAFYFQQGNLRCLHKDDVWTLSSSENEKWLAQVASNTWQTFSQIGKIRVGIKTTADNVFIGDKWEGTLSELELLRPLITHRNAGQIIANNDAQWKVIYTHHTENGKKIPYDIEKYPKTRDYLKSYFEQLSSREYIKKANREWYEIWVPQNPDSWAHKKIVFRDISEKPEFWFDATGAIVNGDCYWIDINPETLEDVVYLALAVANSKFIEKFYDIKFNTKLYSGKRRYQTQYVEQFPIPFYWGDDAQKLISIVKKIIDEGSKETALNYKQKIDDLVEKIFSN